MTKESTIYLEMTKNMYFYYEGTVKQNGALTTSKYLGAVQEPNYALL